MVVRTANCHTDRKYFAKGMCVSCYNKRFYKRKTRKPRKASNLPANCHPDRKNYGGGFCFECYRLRNKRDRIRGVPENATYESLLALQGGLCFICRTSPSEKRRFNMDHDHKTKIV